MLAAADSSSPDLLAPALKGLIETMVAFWPLWLVIGVVVLGKLAWRLYQMRRLSQSGIREIDAMDGRTFEEFLGTLFRRLGYRVENTRYRGDYGADLVITKGDFKTAVQAKRWSKRIGVKAVQEAVASKGYYKCHRALVVANRDFTRQARTLARANEVELWDRDALVGKLLSVREQTPAPAPTQPLDNNGLSPARPNSAPAAADASCVTCGVAVSDEVRDYCLARPQRFGGRIYCYKHQRGVRRALAPSD